MEYFDGVSLAEYVDQRGPLTLALIESVFTPVVGALTAAHDNNIVHRDLKPENIMLREVGGKVEDVKLLDFGIAKLVDSKDMVTSRTGTAMGTPLFMAPEQQRDAKNVDFRADVYSFGATLFHAITGRPPFMATSLADLVLAIHSERAPRLREFAPDASAELESAIAACLERDPTHRPVTVKDAWAAIVDGLGKTTALSLVSGEGAGKASASYAKTIKHGGDTTLGASTSELGVAPERRNSRPVLAITGAVAIACAAAVAFALLKGPGKETMSESPRPTSSTAAATPSMSASIVSDAAPASAVSDAAVSPTVASDDESATKPMPKTTACARSSLERELGNVLSLRKRKSLQRRLQRCLDDGQISKSFFRSAMSGFEAKKPHVPVAKPKPVETVVANVADCSIRRFSVVYNAEAPTGASVRSALQQLKMCRKQLGEARYKQVQTALVAKL